MLELKGMLLGPFAYMWSRWTVRNVKNTTSIEVRSSLAPKKEV